MPFAGFANCCLRRLAYALATLATGLWLPAAAQTVVPYYADTSSYDALAFRVVDQYRLAVGTCLLDPGGGTIDIAGSTIRISIELTPSSCAAGGQDSVSIDRVVGGMQPAPAGTYRVEYGVSVNGNRSLRASTTLSVDDGQDKCGRMPEANVLLVEPASPAIADRIATVVAQPSLDPPLYESLGRPIRAERMLALDWVNLTYGPLDDQHAIKRMIDARSAELGIQSVWTNSFICFGANVPTPIDLEEFFNVDLEHYFMTENREEIAAIDTGGAGPGWRRTGEKLSGYAADACIFSRNPDPLFRFYGTRGLGPNSHFFTADRAECGQVRHDAGWSFEQVPFRVWLPIGGACPAEAIAVRRFYNGRARLNDSNHRFAWRSEVIGAMRAAGWIDEGITLCIPKRS